MIELQTGDERCVIVTPRLHLEFTWTGDRWAHTLAVGAGDGWTVLARSIEGGDDPARVVSPAYQQIHLRDEAGRGQAFLVGQSGPHHFSVVITARDDPGAGPAVVEVDLADRCRASVAALGCTYRVERTSGGLAAADPSRLVWDVGAAGRLTLASSGSARLALAECGRGAARAQVEARIDPASQTRRCYYWWSWTPRSGDLGV